MMVDFLHRENLCLNCNEKGRVPVIEGQNEVHFAQAIQSIICAGDAIGSVILMGKNDREVMGDAEKMLVKTAAGFLGRQMEQ